MTDASSSRAEASASPPTRSSGSPASSSSLAGLALCEQKDDRLGRQPPSHEREHLCRGPIKPLDVIDEADQRALLRRVGQQAQNGEPDQKSIGLRARAQAKRGRQRVTLWRRQPFVDRPAVPRTADADRRTGSSISHSTPVARRIRQSSARSAAYSSSADLPIPGSPRSTNTALFPRRASASS